MQIHGLVADRPFPNGMPTLPGPAVVVKRVPLEAEPLEELARAGFAGLHFTKLGDAPCFAYSGVEMRQMRVVGFRPDVAAPVTRQVLYKGPFHEVADEEGNVYPCGRRVAVSARAWEVLRQGPAAGQFLFFPETPAGCCQG